MSIGSDLRQIRESKKITLETVSQKTKIPVKYLECIEEDNFTVFPSHTYARGFIRAYAKVVGADAYVMTRQFNVEMNPERVKIEPHQIEEEKVKVPEPRHAWSKNFPSGGEPPVGGELNLELVEKSAEKEEPLTPPQDRPTVLDFRLARRSAINYQQLGKILTVILAVALGAAAVFYGWKGISKIALAVKSRPVVVKEAEAPPPVVDKYQHLMLKALDKCWVRVTIDGGKSVQEADLVQGDFKTYQAEKEFKVKIGNAAGVDAQFNGKSLGVLGVKGQVVEIHLPRGRAAKPKAGADDSNPAANVVPSAM